MKREKARLTTRKQLGIFLEQKKGDVREDELGEFYFLEKGMELA